MALWGNNDNRLTATAGVVTASGFNGTVIGHGTTFTNFSVAQTLTVAHLVKHLTPQLVSVLMLFPL